MSERERPRRGGRPGRRPRPEPSGEGSVPPERAELAGRILALLRAEVPSGDLAREIEALRQVLGEVLLAEPDPRKLVSAVARPRRRGGMNAILAPGAKAPG